MTLFNGRCQLFQYGDVRCTKLGFVGDETSTPFDDHPVTHVTPTTKSLMSIPLQFLFESTFLHQGFMTHRTERLTCPTVHL